jgi:solute carrier family 25 carnitine/acylcarnitine transporter 20/29
MGVEAELEAPEHGFQRTLKDLFAGAVGGVAQVLIGT